jgi:hypothetical protein
MRDIWLRFVFIVSNFLILRLRVVNIQLSDRFPLVYILLLFNVDDINIDSSILIPVNYLFYDNRLLFFSFFINRSVSDWGLYLQRLTEYSLIRVLFLDRWQILGFICKFDIFLIVNILVRELIILSVKCLPCFN